MPNPYDIQLMNGLGRNMVAASASTGSSAPRQNVGIIIEYVGSQASALLTIGATSIASAVGASGSEAADANFTVGATPGTIDLTNSAVDTAGELVDFINSLADYRARLVGLRRADTISTSGYFVAASSQQGKVKGVGLSVYVDVTVAKHVTTEISVLDGQMYSGGSKNDQSVSTRTIREFSGLNGDYKRSSLVELFQVDETLTYTGTGTFEVIEVDDFNQTDRVIYTGSIPGATTVAGSKSFGQLGVSGVAALAGKRLLVRARAATTLSAVTNWVVYGKIKALA